MAKLGEFIAFRAAIALIKESGEEDLLQSVYHSCKEELTKPDENMSNKVQQIYEPFSDIEISNKIAHLLTTSSINAKVEIIYQTVSNLHKAIPNHKGDWYFTGNYPTPGGNRVVNEAFINYFEGNNKRAY
jgi:amidophosphoribosyltransferase